jgi:Family of unknown function (DUF695)
MKRIAVTLCSALVASALAATDTPAPEKPPDIGWLVRESKLHDKTFVVKVRNEIPASAVPIKYPNAIEMHWKYAPDSLGMPAERVALELARFEAAVDPIQGDHIGYLMTIITGDGERTWLWYVADPKAFAAALNRLVPGHPFPITLNAVANEPDWKTYRTMREKVH